MSFHFRQEKGKGIGMEAAVLFYMLPPLYFYPKSLPISLPPPAFINAFWSEEEKR